jgi:2-polyprenyl-3-methyl-5-hydroxy-6-metoxy-1,4-benzoquinol methylase
MDLKEKFEHESHDFDQIATDRYKNNQIPDLRVEFVNEYFYNNIWRNSIFLKQEYGPLVNWIIEMLKKAKSTKVLETGCGNGFLSLELAREGFDVTGLDISPESIKIASGYLDIQKDKESLSLKYLCENLTEYKEYQGESIVFFGFLHHLPPDVLKDFVKMISEKMKPGQIFLGIEPRYDHVNYPMAAMIYGLRQSLPNYFKYDEKPDKSGAYIQEIYEELGEIKKEQSTNDNESPSEFIIKVMKENFEKVELSYTTAFFDKLIGGMRVEKEDTDSLSKVLKQLDNIIVKYNPGFARNLKIIAYK